MKLAPFLYVVLACAFVSAAWAQPATDKTANPAAARTETTRLPKTRVLINTLEIAGGRLVISGVTPQPKMQVTLDGTFSTASDTDGRFAFSLFYLPPDCTVR